MPHTLGGYSLVKGTVVSLRLRSTLQKCLCFWLQIMPLNGTLDSWLNRLSTLLLKVFSQRCPAQPNLGDHFLTMVAAYMQDPMNEQLRIPRSSRPPYSCFIKSDLIHTRPSFSQLENEISSEIWSPPYPSNEQEWSDSPKPPTWIGSRIKPYYQIVSLLTESKSSPMTYDYLTKPRQIRTTYPTNPKS